jgi:hypothetical protein
MSSTFPLPLECLQLIIHHLTAQRARKSVASLLCANKYVCAATLPFLYQDPFVNMYPIGKLSDGAPNFGYRIVGMDNETVLGLMHLVRVLLLSMPPNAPHNGQDGQDGHRCSHELITELVQVAFFQGQDRGEDDAVESTETSEQDSNRTVLPQLLVPPTPFLPYYSFITKVTFESTSHAAGILLNNGLLSKKPTVQDYMKRTGRADQACAQEPFRRFMWRDPEGAIVSRACEMQLRQDLTWALCCSNAERIQILEISIADVGRYLALVPRLKVLSEVNFQLDRNLTMQVRHDHQWTPEEEKVLAMLKEDRTRQLEEMILFVQEHQRHHPKSIRTARCLNDRAFNDPCPDEYHFRLIQSLPSLHQPQYLDRNNWAQFAAKVAETDLSCVKYIHPEVKDNLVRFSSQIMEQGPFLQRCRSLENISSPSFKEDMFKWAVQERKDFDCSIDKATSQRPLVPLRNYDIRFPVPSFGRQVDDVTYAFSDTLESMSISGFAPDDFNVDQNWPEFLLGCGDIDNNNNHSNDADVDRVPSWPYLPRLIVLYVSTTWIYLRVHRRLLTLLPRLTFLTLDDKRSRYNLADVVHWEPAELPELKHLSLTGTAAISFHPDTFKSTQNLVRLDLRMEFHDAYSFIPHPVQFDETDDEIVNEGGEFVDNHDENDGENNSSFSTPSPQRRRPAWTWDWELPKLAHLSLTSEFAYRFQFRMLDGTPSLSYFSVNINSFSRLHKRTVGIADLIKPGFQHPELERFLERERQQQETRRRRERHILDHSSSTSDLGETNEEELEEEEKEGEKDTDGYDEIWEEFEFVDLPALKKFWLIGPWMLDYRVLKVLFGRIASKMEVVNLPECFGFTVSEWVKATSENLHNLLEGFVTTSNTPRLLAEAGLVDFAELTGGFHRKLYQLAERPVGRVLDIPAKYEFGRSDYYGTMPIDVL